jgi:hypothetical protein
MASTNDVVDSLRLNFFALVLFSLSLTPGAAVALDLAELELNRALWNSHNISDYDFILGRSCFCDPLFVRPGLVMVRQDAISTVIDAETHEPRRLGDFFTIDAAFDSLRDSFHSQSITIVTAEFDPQLGYPRRIRYDEPELFDDDITYGILAFRVVPEPASVFLALIALATLRVRRSSQHVFLEVNYSISV